ncbi:MAG: M15 family metallopeptidase [Clostridium sp.]|nr:M15 family metallopeptidase [Clostridium sp.]MCM1398791.1 M15 family metallopeptidase [Clostridium sp.]MCM1458577.1 M15 family metallopeptidase [Bacteroides sp.]
MDIQGFFARLLKSLKKTGKKIKKFFRRYTRLLVRHTKAGDYSVLIYTITVLVVFALIIVLVVNILKPDKKEKKKDLAPVATKSDAVTELKDPNAELANECQAIYDKNKELLLLVNTKTAIPEDYEFEQHVLNSGAIIDERAYIDLYRMLKACNDAGYHYSIISAYRDKETQQGVIDRNVQELMDKGLNQDEAYEKTLETVQAVGHSEHETGLALDLTEEGVYGLTEDLETNETIKWFTDNCTQYGFVVRYPKDKADVTGISYEPWHFRYVGEEAARFMTEHNLTLDEFHSLINY